MKKLIFYVYILTFLGIFNTNILEAANKRKNSSVGSQTKKTNKKRRIEKDTKKTEFIDFLSINSNKPSTIDNTPKSIENLLTNKNQINECLNQNEGPFKILIELIEQAIEKLNRIDESNTHMSNKINEYEEKFKKFENQLKELKRNMKNGFIELKHEIDKKQNNPYSIEAIKITPKTTNLTIEDSTDTDDNN